MILPCEGCSSALAPASPSTWGRDAGLELQFDCSMPPKEPGREQPWGCWRWCWAGGMAPATTARLRQPGTQSSLWNCYHKGKDKSLLWGFLACFFSLVSLCLGPGPGCQRGFGVSVHSLGSCLILAFKLGLQLPALWSLGVDGSVTAAVNWAAA